MTYAYPLSLPAWPPPRRVAMSPYSAVAVVRSPFSLAGQAQDWGGKIWQADVDLPPMQVAEAAAWRAFKLKLNGRAGTFLMGDPAYAGPRGTMAGTPVVDGAGQSGQSLAIRGLTPSATSVLLAGDYLQLGTGATSRLHMNLTDADADGAGEAELDLWPDLRESPADGAAIVTAEPVGVWRMADAAMAWDAEPLVWGFSFSCVEDL